MISKKIYGVNITEDIIRELRQNGRSHVLTMKDKVGKQYLGRFVVKGDRSGSRGRRTLPRASLSTLRRAYPHHKQRILLREQSRETADL